MKSKVSIVKCRDYGLSSLKPSLEKALELIGGIRAFVKPSAKVLLKPNLLSARGPEDAVVTHPEFIRAVSIIVKEAGGLPAIGDSPGSFRTVKSIDEVYEKSGVKKVADEEGVELVRFDKAIHIDGYPISKALKDFDLMINLPKLKTHTLAMLTGAVKNTFGFVPGLSKMQCHKKAPNINEFSGILADIYAITRPELSIMDGITGMDGDGPAAGRIRNMDLIMASADAVSLDAVLSHIAGLPHDKNRVLKEVTARGLGKGRLDDIEVLGESLSSSVIKDFKLPKTELIYLFPSRLGRPIAKLIAFRPVIDEITCKKCGICKESCPVDAITINERVSRVDKKACVKCFCCHEVCPYDAICIKKSPIAKLIWR